MSCSAAILSHFPSSSLLASGPGTSGTLLLPQLLRVNVPAFLVSLLPVLVSALSSGSCPHSAVYWLMLFLSHHHVLGALCSSAGACGLAASLRITSRHTRTLGLVRCLWVSPQRLTGFARDAARGLCSRGLGAEGQIHCLKTMCDPVGKVGKGQSCDTRPGEIKGLRTVEGLWKNRGAIPALLNPAPYRKPASGPNQMCASVLPHVFLTWISQVSFQKSLVIIVNGSCHTGPGF